MFYVSEQFFQLLQEKNTTYIVGKDVFRDQR